ncbi:MAG: hypothetical protein EOO03_01030 [Chitinophagaceae bacterium]|nr:MAG: hypothetical protein EOO03_01030 [Chitinophagaceae bacterium]
MHNEPARDVNFEILGKIGNNYLVYKNMRDRNIMQVFDDQMNELSNHLLKEMPDKVINVDFITYPSYALMVYQYKRNSVLHCDAIKIDGNGKAVGNAIKLDTTRVGIQSGRDIYGTVYSEDKSNILVYKFHERSEKLHVVTKIYNPSLVLQDSTRSLIDYNERREQYSPFQIANDGTIFLTKEIKAGSRENISELEIITSKLKSNEFRATAVNLQQKYIDGVQIKVDNLNNNFIINSFYYEGRRSSNIEGLFTAVVSKGTDSARTAVTKFDDSLRLKMNTSGKFRTAFDNLFLKNIFVKRDGSYVLVAEDFYTQTQGGGNSWNRWDYMYGDPYSIYNSFYWNSPYYRYNRFNSFNSFNNPRSTLYYYDNVLVMSIDSSLKMNWNNVILKKQTNNEDDSFLSFGTMITGGEINFLYIEKEKNTQIISNQSISTYGKLYRYPTLKSRERGYQFMPRLSKQVGAKEVIMPCVYRGNMCFAKIDFTR